MAPLFVLVGATVALLPANVSAALRGVTLRGETVTPLWLRVPLQILFIAVTWWTAIQRPGDGFSAYWKRTRLDARRRTEENERVR